MKNLVIIPTYNEKENIEKMIRKVMSLKDGFHLLIVDDGSPDGTGQIVKDLQADYANRLHILERRGKLGLELLILLVFVGVWNVIMIIFLKWIVIFPTIHKI